MTPRLDAILARARKARIGAELTTTEQRELAEAYDALAIRFNDAEAAAEASSVAARGWEHEFRALQERNAPQPAPPKPRHTPTHEVCPLCQNQGGTPMCPECCLNPYEAATAAAARRAAMKPRASRRPK